MARMSVERSFTVFVDYSSHNMSDVGTEYTLWEVIPLSHNTEKTMTYFIKGF